jgi:SNF2 family DNA or RNA helicase
MGLGKTIQALLVLYVLGAFPAVIVCPASLRLNWAREIRRALPGRSVYVVRDAKTPMPTEAADVTVVNYDVLRKREEALLAIGAAAVVLDESHYIKNGKAQRTKSAKKLVKAATKVRLLLSGTPVVNRPSELISQLDAIGRLDDFGGFWAFANRFCGAYRSSYGWDLGGATNLPELNERLRSRCYVRRTKEQVLPELPAKQRATVAVDLTNRAEYERAERELIAWLRDRAANDADFLREIAGLDADEQKVAKRARAAEAEAKARHAEALVRIEALKQLAARGKLDAVVEWVESFLESGEKLVLFAHHREIVDALAQRFGAPSITGSTKLEDRQAAVDAFQADPETRLLVANIRAGGVGLTLTAASNVAFCELEWTPAAHDQAEDRCHRIGQSDSVTAWYLLADRTIDGEIARLIEAKRAVVTAATDGEAPEAGEGIMKDLVASLLGDEQTDITSRRGS